MCGDDVRPLIQDAVECIVVLNVENRNCAPPQGEMWRHAPQING